MISSCEYIKDYRIMLIDCMHYMYIVCMGIG